MFPETVNLTTHGVKSYHLDVIVNYEPPTILNVTFQVKDMIKVEVPKLLTFHPQLEVQGIPHDILSDPGIYPVYNPHHVTYGLSALLCGVILVMIISVICVWMKCARKPSKYTRDATHVWGKNRKTENIYFCHQWPFPSPQTP